MKETALPRLVAAAFLMFAIGVAIIEFGREEDEVRANRPIDTAFEDPLRGALQRCQALGEAAVRDTACLDAWAENRRRFLSPDPASERSE
ncbi:putative entry exclusion protein TrbK-alt [Boseongicola sp. H5]|uniref:putative entry exclusion protein TrbK-alt n=1 Tax=Boseongicola sp. H5 TaxID=2763261 RepID=UPI001D09B1BE|nr:putative entry exclusion protein TrbK-alt [Boseongicola sp. H5]